MTTVLVLDIAFDSTPPLLQSLESTFGILPPQSTVMYSLLNGRFTSLSRIPPKQDGYMPVTTYIPVSITGGGATGLGGNAPAESTVVAAMTPYRTWPW